ANDELNPTTYSDYDLLLWDSTRYTNWQEELIGGTAHQTKAQLSVSGGNKNTQFYFSGGYLRESTVFPEPLPFQRGCLHFNGSHSSDNKKFRISLSSNFTRSKSVLPRNSFLRMALTLPPNAPDPFNQAGNINWQDFDTNPYADLLETRNGQTINTINNLS